MEQADMAQGKNGEAPNIIIKKIKKIEAGHHGGAWKVAYADFVTAMMAFFLMLWLLSTTSKEQKEGLAEYFSLAQVSTATGGGDGMLSGKSLNSDRSVADGAPSITLSLAPPAPPPSSEAETENETSSAGSTVSAEVTSAENAVAAVSLAENTKGAGGAHEVISNMDAQRTTATPTEDAVNKVIAEREKKVFEKAEKELKQAISDIPELAQLSGQLIIDHTPEGMRIQLVDEADRPMFKEGTPDPYARTRAIFKEIAKVINKLPNRIAISGHTDASALQRADGYSNWELSMDRAMISRRLLQQAGVPDTRFFEVTGKASTEPLFPDDPYISGNRRISITMMREMSALAPNALGAN